MNYKLGILVAVIFFLTIIFCFMFVNSIDDKRKELITYVFAIFLVIFGSLGAAFIYSL